MLDPNTVTPTTTTPPMPIAPTTTPTAPAAPQSDSNAPDADTQAAASMPKNLVNNPQVPSQKIAAQVDANKTSPAPSHTMLYRAAQELSGGPRYKTTYDAAGNVVRTEVPVSPVHLGLALALQVLQGGMAGAKAPANRPGQAFEAGEQVAAQKRAQIQKANQEQDAQAAADQKHKLDVTEANMRNYQTAVNAGKSSIEASKAFGDSFKLITDGLQDGSITLPAGVSKSDPVWETDAMAAIKNGKTNITKSLLIPVGEPKPVIGADGQQVIVNGVPQVGHDYITVSGLTPDGKISLTKEMQDAFVGAGIMPALPAAGIGEPAWSLADVAKKSAALASINAGEQMLQDHKDDAHDLLGRPQEDLDDLKNLVKTNPRMRTAVSVFSQAQMGAGNGHIEDILNAMGQRDPASRGLLMNYLHLTEKDLDDMHNKRVEAETEAKAKPAKPLAIDSADKANAILADPSETSARKQQANDFLKGSTTTAASKAGAEAAARTKAEAGGGDVQQAARNILSGDLTNLKDITSMRGGQRTAMFNAIHDEAVAQGKNPNDWSPAALKTKSDMYEDFRQGKTSNNIAAFDAFLGHAGDAMDATENMRKKVLAGAPSPILNRPLNWIEKNASNDPDYISFTTSLEPVRKEFMSFLNANRAEHEADLKTMQTVLSDSETPAQIESALKQLGKSADIRLAAIGRKYQNTMGTAFPNLISDDGKATLQRMGITSKTAPTSNAPSRIVPAGAIPGRDASGNIIGYKTADGKVVKF